MNLEEKSNVLLARDIHLGDLWNIMVKFNLDTVVDAIDHCFERVKNNKCIWTK
jgi:hypothetical protein